MLLVGTIAVSLALCIFLKKEVQMPWWGLIFASGLAFIFTLPVSIITATTNQVSYSLRLKFLNILISRPPKIIKNHDFVLYRHQD